MATLSHRRCILALGLMLAACSLPPLTPTAPLLQPTATVTLVPTATLPDIAFPTGVFHTRNQDGQWVITFQADGTYLVSLNGERIVSESQYTVADQQVTLEDDSEVCRGRGTGQYTWSFAQEVLTFTALSDACPERQVVLTNGLAKQP